MEIVEPTIPEFYKPEADATAKIQYSGVQVDPGEYPVVNMAGEAVRVVDFSVLLKEFFRALWSRTFPCPKRIGIPKVANILDSRLAVSQALSAQLQFA